MRLLTTTDIAKATGLMVANGTAGSNPRHAREMHLGRDRNTRVIVTLADTQHMELTVKAEQKRRRRRSGAGF
jgi:hypothetical protein